jgi:hypothetical protein
MKVSDLYNDPAIRGHDVYIVGLGPSMRVFPTSFLKNKLCVLLNDASKIFQLGPIAFTNHKQWIEPVNIQHIKYQIVKARCKSDLNPHKTDNHVPWNHQIYYCFSYREHPWDKVSHYDKNQLWKEPDYYWNMKDGTVAIFAVQFALLAGAKSITLVGCDCIALQGQHYVAKDISKYKQKQHNYDNYAKGLLILREEAQKRFNVPLLTLTPFCGLGREQTQYEFLSKQLCPQTQ